MGPNTVCHIEFEVKDFARAKDFYAAIFGWDFRAFGDSMMVFGVGASHVGGFQKVDEVRPAACASVWFEIEDIDKLLSVAEQKGGAKLCPKNFVQGVGWTAVIGDPDGNPVGLVQFDRS